MLLIARAISSHVQQPGVCRSYAARSADVAERMTTLRSLAPSIEKKPRPESAGVGAARHAQLELRQASGARAHTDDLDAHNPNPHPPEPHQAPPCLPPLAPVHQSLTRAHRESPSTIERRVRRVRDVARVS